MLVLTPRILMPSMIRVAVPMSISKLIANCSLLRRLHWLNGGWSANARRVGAECNSRFHSCGNFWSKILREGRWMDIAGVNSLMGFSGLEIWWELLERRDTLYVV